MSGPTQLLVVGSGGGAAFEGRILEEIDRLQGRGVLRLLDALFVTKNEDGTITRLAIGGDDLGELIVSVVPLDAAGLFGLLAGNDVSGPDIADANRLAESLTPGDALAFLLVEHRWARPLFDAIADTGGTILGEGFITNEAELLVGAEVAAMDEAARVIAAAQAVEAEALLRSIAATDAADDAIATADAIRAAAAVDSIRALIEAGLIEDAAFHEAADALVAAGVIVAAAERSSAEAASAASVTPGEIRVLRHLETGIRFAVVADKLGISRSAAKERAERAYKKLGVHNSAEAVARAKELGLIPKSS
ncbi:MAG TPA: LuxR C-terminal-related transcriptional regulator [Candidatus Saccharimonadales bacterium]|nr:LuxR C-terminal-related transcriptional regulator [Candidatus Saccharimonadales bacterium]